jgi:endonuclease YncB( thermonuclease family)
MKIIEWMFKGILMTMASLGTLAMAALLFGAVAHAQDLYVPVINVYDGDTVETRLTLPSPLDKVSVRIYGIDTPEMPAKSYATTGKLNRAKCIQEAELALLAQAYVEDLVKDNGNLLLLRAYSWDKYGGRIDADTYVVDLATGIEINIADQLISNGMAVEYYGGKKTKNWCE